MRSTRHLDSEIRDSAAAGPVERDFGRTAARAPTIRTSVSLAGLAPRTHHHLSDHHTARTSTRSAVVPTPVVRERAADPQQQSQHDKTLQTPSCQMGKEEQSSHAPSADPPANAPFVNGALAVPDAPANTDTVPALCGLLRGCAEPDI
jgi:hypothetical protein